MIAEPKLRTIQKDLAAEREEQKTVAVAATIIREKMRVGRNDPCPCGSGKKFKKCCIGEPNFGHRVYYKYRSESDSAGNTPRKPKRVGRGRP